ncbi:TetR/AcrR family transcriptional regulator [Mycolicibacterium boenickei]
MVLTLRSYGIYLGLVSVEGRRTQAERRAATELRLLTATIDCLVDQGYANTSTRDIAGRAGVTLGALQHHFAGKADLMAAALRALGNRMADEFMIEAQDVGTPSERISQLLDRVWRAHRGPLFTAGLELWVAARTDPALHAAMSDVADSQAQRVAEGMIGAFPELAADPGFAEAVMIGLATLRGLAMSDLVGGVDPDVLWAIAKPQMLNSFEGSPFGAVASDN